MVSLLDGNCSRLRRLQHCPRRPCSTAVEFCHNMLHDDFSFVSHIVFQIENFAEADCINTFPSSSCFSSLGLSSCSDRACSAGVPGIRVDGSSEVTATEASSLGLPEAAALLLEAATLAGSLAEHPLLTARLTGHPGLL